jgi:hypothetical protein
MSSRNGQGNPLDRQVGGGHYTKYRIQPKVFYHANKVPALESQAMDYILRHGDKGKAEDLHKAIHILEILIYLEYTTAEKPAALCEPTDTSTQVPTDTQEECTIADRTIFHILRHTFDRHEMDTEKNTASDLIAALRKDREDEAASDLISLIAHQPQMNASIKLDSLFRLFTEGEITCTSCGG